MGRLLTCTEAVERALEGLGAAERACETDRDEPEERTITGDDLPDDEGVLICEADLT